MSEHGRAPTLAGIRMAGPKDAMYSVESRALAVGGHYVPGGVPTVVDPLWTRARSPQAVQAHELEHQSLSINTTFGGFMLGLHSLARRGLVRDAHRVCYDAQWKLHELAATYAEMVMVATEAPGQLDAAIRDLPSNFLNEPPYRELFEHTSRWLPVHSTDPPQTNDGKRLVLSMLAHIAMCSDCVRRALERPAGDAELVACITESPNDRFDRLLAELVRKNALPDLVRDAERLFHAEETRATAGALLLERIAYEISDVSFESVPEFLQQTDQLGDAWGIDFVHQDQPPLAKVEYSRERARAEGNSLRALSVERLQPLAQDRLELRADGRLELTLKNVWKDGTRAVVLEPDDLLVRLCAAVPAPRMHLLRYFGVLSSHNASKRMSRGVRPRDPFRLLVGSRAQLAIYPTAATPDSEGDTEALCANSLAPRSSTTTLSPGRTPIASAFSLPRFTVSVRSLGSRSSSFTCQPRRVERKTAAGMPFASDADGRFTSTSCGRTKASMRASFSDRSAGAGQPRSWPSSSVRPPAMRPSSRFDEPMKLATNGVRGAS
jgi:hypothetical protein